MSNFKKYVKNKPPKVPIDAEFRMQIEKDVMKFVDSNEMTFEFSASLSNVERAFVHNLAPKYNLKTKSHGFGKLIHFYNQVQGVQGQYPI